ncbi:C40 family peptidase [Flexivirga sp. B27]
MGCRARSTSLVTTLAVVTSGLLAMTGLTAPTAHAVETPEPAPEIAYVDVAVATLWTEPGIDRPIDAPAVGNPVDPRKWTDEQTVAQRRWLVGKLETQALYGQRVTVLERSGGWAHVVVAGQPTPRNPLGYPGWVPAKQLTSNPAFGHKTDRRFALVSAKTTGLYADPTLKHSSMKLSINTRLPVLGTTKDAIKVFTPDRGASWIAKSDAQVYNSPSDIPQPTPADLARTARMFAGLPYVWAGTSAWGFDCSGFTHTVYAVHGMTIPRDAGDQMRAGRPVAKDTMQPGDLIFYAYASGYIHHVGMYLGDGWEADAPNNTPGQVSRLEIVKVDQQRYADQYAGSRRYL